MSDGSVSGKTGKRIWKEKRKWLKEWKAYEIKGRGRVYWEMGLLGVNCNNEKRTYLLIVFSFLYNPPLKKMADLVDLCDVPCGFGLGCSSGHIRG